ncbi:hypothetical protein CBS147343_7523 [Aspergillus niger]|nr:hypothetical protein CBS133816_8015 [Aspergillus niger]KAI2850716.1 hypothetical protein CBS12448_8661 [Aspergillus niger]KAI2903915.1 hypothetical protein CBS11852_1926 [Aspergillus niger]KAI2943746.1 hypothetical protein CBS147321_4683 [Aspergillus niger]KAI2967287.1 hypothetical protein CBS147324_7064 [Aspergillus niger]
MWLPHGKLVLASFVIFIQWALCRVVEYNLTLTWEDLEVAGITRKAVLINGQFPGPPLRLKQGDNVEVMVTNNMPFSTTIHFHGIRQQGTPWSDGVPGLTQLPIGPGSQFLYAWKADDYGTYIYHSHEAARIDDGLYGAIYIEPADNIEKPFSIITTDEVELEFLKKAEQNTQPVILSDWRRFTSDEIWYIEEQSGVESYCASSILVNGKGSTYCPPQEQINELTRPELKSLLKGGNMSDMGYDLINIAGSSSLVFSVDEHPLYIYAVDGRYVEPVLVDALTIHIGARYSVMAKLDQAAGNYTVRIANSYANQIINGTAVLSYEAPIEQDFVSQPYITEIGTAVSRQTSILDESNLVPFPAIPPASDVDRTYILNIHMYNASYRWVLGNDSFPLSLEHLSTPVLYNISSIPVQYTLPTLNDTWVDIIFNVTVDEPQHPLHKHSNKFFVIGEGTGPWTYSSVAEAVEHIPEKFNFVNPQIRDTYPTPNSREGGAWLAIRYYVENPGPFLLHCHVLMHQVGGLDIALLDGIDAWPTVPENVNLP